VIEVSELSKRYGRRTAVDRMTFDAPAGTVTGFLGPNGSGKTTTVRLLLGLATPTAGRALIGGRRYAELRHPMREVGALLDPTASYGGRRVRTQLRWQAALGDVPASRVDVVLDEVGLTDQAEQRMRVLSLGQRQRLGLAAALLGDPAVLLLDEPVNGLDVAGIRWIRGLLRRLAAEGRTVLMSSHLMSEVEQTVDRLVVVAAGRVLAERPLAGFADGRPGGLEDAYLDLVERGTAGMR
jgi:ABC-2 type transport system ATP-binding protein